MITQLANAGPAGTDQPPATPPVQTPLPQGVPGAPQIAQPPAIPGTNLKGALGQATQAAGVIQKAAGAQMAATPEYQQATGLASKISQTYQDAALANARRSGQMEALVNAPEPERVSVPRLKELPSAPVEEHKDPLRALGQFLPLLAVFGAMSTAAPATNALNAATAAINATRSRDKEAEEKAHGMWMDNMKLALASNEQLTNQYNLALADRNATMSERLARVQSFATLNHDSLVTAQLASGSLEPVMKLLEFRTKAAEPLQHILDSTMEDQRQRDFQRDASARGWIEENIRLYQAQAAAGQKAQVQPDDVAGQIFARMAAGETPTAQDNATLEQIYRYRAAAASQNPLAAILQQGGAQPPPAAGAQPAAQTPTAAAPTAAVTTPQDSTYSARVAQAKAALGRGAPRDQVRQVWVQSGLPAAEFDKQVR